MAHCRVFVTVGTTQFDSLIKAVLEEESLSKLNERGYTDLVLQVGQGSIEVPLDGEVRYGINITSFSLKPSIKEEFAAADLVISHAGAGSCMEALAAGKPLIAVVNDTLMDNHQTELAEELSKNGFCLFCFPRTLMETIASMDLSKLSTYVPGQPKIVADHLDMLFQNVV